MTFRACVMSLNATALNMSWVDGYTNVSTHLDRVAGSGFEKGASKPNAESRTQNTEQCLGLCWLGLARPSHRPCTPYTPSSTQPGSRYRCGKST